MKKVQVSRRRGKPFAYREKIYSHISPELLEALDELSGALQTSRSHAIELLLSVALGEKRKVFSNAIKKRIETNVDMKKRR